MTNKTETSESKVKYADGNISETQKDYMKLIEQKNLERVQKLKKLRRNNILTAACLGGSVLAIYAYSMLSVKQEKFLDDFDEPVKVELGK